MPQETVLTNSDCFWKDFSALGLLSCKGLSFVKMNSMAGMWWCRITYLRNPTWAATAGRILLLYPAIRVSRVRASSTMMVLLLLSFQHRSHRRLKTSPTVLASVSTRGSVLWTKPPLMPVILQPQPLPQFQRRRSRRSSRRS